MDKNIVLSPLSATSGKAYSVNPLGIQSEILSLIKQSESEEKFLEGILRLLLALLNASGAVILEGREQGQFFFRQEVFQGNIIAEKERILLEMSGLSIVTQKKGNTRFTNFLSSDGRLLHIILTPPLEPFGIHLGVVLEMAPGTMIEPFLIIVQLMSGEISLYALQKGFLENQRYAQESAAVVDMFLDASQKNDLKGSLASLLHQIKKHISCHEIALGFIKGSRATLQVLSSPGEIDRRTPLSRAIEEAMEETARGKQPLFYPQPLSKKTVQIDLSQQKLVELSGCEEAFSIPFIKRDGKVSLVWTFLWNQEHPFEPSTKNFLLAIVNPLGYFIERLRNADAGTGKKVVQAAGKVFEKARVFLFLLLSLLVVWSFTLPVTHTINTTCELQPFVRRMVGAPFEAVLRESYYKTGDFVKEGQVLASLDGKEMRLELAALEAEYSKAVKEMDSALAEKKIASYQIARLKAEKFALRKRVLKERLDQLEILAPIEGVILSGDLKRVQGVTISIGQALFELAPLEKMLVEIYVDAQDISYVQKGLTGKMMLESYSGEPFPLCIDDVKPISEIKDSRNVFVCQAIIENPERKLRPGVKGKVKLTAGQEPLWWVLFHKPIEWIKLQLWW